MRASPRSPINPVRPSGGALSFLSLPKGLESGQPGTWWPQITSWGGFSAHVSCECGKSTSLHGYSIDPEIGAVSPPIVCRGCYTLREVRLAGWVDWRRQ